MSRKKNILGSLAAGLILTLFTLAWMAIHYNDVFTGQIGSGYALWAFLMWAIYSCLVYGGFGVYPFSLRRLLASIASGVTASAFFVAGAIWMNRKSGGTTGIVSFKDLAPFYVVATVLFVSGGFYSHWSDKARERLAAKESSEQS